MTAPIDPSSQIELQVVPRASIFVHEYMDPSRSQKLLAAIQATGIQAHPIIAAELPDGHRIHADGANRLHCLRECGCDMVLAQIVRPEVPGLCSLDVWSHIVQMTSEAFLSTVGNTASALVESVGGFVSSVAPDDVAIVTFEHGAYRVKARSRALADRLSVVSAIVGLYEGPLRLAGTALLPPSLLDGGRAPQERGATVAFAPFTVDDFMELGARRLRIPAGITRFLLPAGRALGVNLPLTLLNGSSAPACIEAHFASLPSPRVYPSGGVVQEYQGPREYEEPLYVFDPMLPVAPRLELAS